MITQVFSACKSYLGQLNGLMVIITLSVFYGLVSLAYWQWDRSQEKQNRLDKIAQYNKEQPLTLMKTMQQLQVEISTINDVKVQARGHFEPSFVFLVDNKFHKGKLGYEVLQVLTSPLGNVLVNLGWVAGRQYREQLPVITPYSGNENFIARVRFIEKGIMLAQQHYPKHQWPLRVQQIDIKAIATHLDIELLPFILQVEQSETLGFEKNWQAIVMPPEKHQAYAFQWAVLALTWLVLMIAASVWSQRSNG